MSVPRPGGRTARTRAAVFEAAEDLLKERGPAKIAMADIAQRAGVAATSLYRRWGTLDALLFEVSVERLRCAKPIPDSGTIRGDLLAWGRALIKGLRNPSGSSIFMVLVASVARMETPPEFRAKALEPRIEQLRQMMERARQRGEKNPPIEDIRDFFLAPLYTRFLFGGELKNASLDRLINRLFDRL